VATKRSRISLTSISTVTPTPDLLGRAWKLRDNISAYDAMYVALAEAIDAPMVTCDSPLSQAPGHRARIEVID
jgi:predicted nucleic acid-binding protein